MHTHKPLQVPAWKAAYRGIISNDFLDHSPSLHVKRKVEKWKKILAAPPRVKQTLVLCLVPSKVLGYVTVSKVLPRDQRRFGAVLPVGVNICAGE